MALDAHKQERAALDANTLRHAAGRPAQHAVGGSSLAVLRGARCCVVKVVDGVLTRAGCCRPA